MAIALARRTDLQLLGRAELLYCHPGCHWTWTPRSASNFGSCTRPGPCSRATGSRPSAVPHGRRTDLCVRNAVSPKLRSHCAPARHLSNCRGKHACKWGLECSATSRTPARSDPDAVSNQSGQQVSTSTLTNQFYNMKTSIYF